MVSREAALQACRDARANAEKHYGVAEGVGADMAMRRIAALSASPSTPIPVIAEAGERERIARIIDPAAWQSRAAFQAIIAGADPALPSDPEKRAMYVRSATRRVDTVVAQSLTTADEIIAALSTPATLDNAAVQENEVSTFLSELRGGKLVREMMAAGAIIDVMTGKKFDWRERLHDSDFLESGDWLTALAYARAALSPALDNTAAEGPIATADRDAASLDLYDPDYAGEYGAWWDGYWDYAEECWRAAIWCQSCTTWHDTKITPTLWRARPQAPAVATLTAKTEKAE